MKTRITILSSMFACLFVVAAASTAYAGSVIYNAAVLADNPDYFWTFDEVSGAALNLGTQGAGGGANDLAADTGATRGAGGTTNGGESLGSAALFGGAANQRFISGALTDGGFTNYIIEFWIKDAPGSVNEYIFEHGFNSNAPSAIVGFNTGGGPNGVELFSPAGRTGSDGPSVSDDAWHHVVIGIVGGGSHTIYVDGVLHSVQPENISAWTGGIPLYVGNAGNNTVAFTGSLDELAIYNAGAGDVAALTADIADHYNVTIPAPAALPAGLALIGLFATSRRRG